MSVLRLVYSFFYRHVGEVTVFMLLPVSDSSGEPLCLISSSVESEAELLKVEYHKVRTQSQRAGSRYLSCRFTDPPVCDSSGRPLWDGLLFCL